MPFTIHFSTQNPKQDTWLLLYLPLHETDALSLTDATYNCPVYHTLNVISLKVQGVFTTNFLMEKMSYIVANIVISLLVSNYFSVSDCYNCV
jgi:hypothetical protein